MTATPTPTRKRYTFRATANNGHTYQLYATAINEEHGRFILQHHGVALELVKVTLIN